MPHAVLEELDAPGEWYYDPTGKKLYAYPNMTAGAWASANISLSTQAAVVEIVGTPSSPAINVSLIGLTFTGTASTFLEQYEVPSGGDWSIHRGGAVFVQDAEGLQVRAIYYYYNYYLFIFVLVPMVFNGVNACASCVLHCSSRIITGDTN